MSTNRERIPSKLFHISKKENLEMMILIALLSAVGSFVGVVLANLAINSALF